MVEFLTDLDLKRGTNCKLPVFGGFAVTIQYRISRLTSERYIAELRDNTVGDAKDNDAVFYRWIEAIRENREMLKWQ
jgi:hypothetical protein